MELAEKRECPICGCETGHLNNHVRMKNDDEHGPTAVYPDDWDAEREVLDSGADVDEGGSGVDVDAADVDAADVDEQPEAVPIEIDDRPSDMREYQCDECEASIEYLAEECPNEHEQQWYA